MRRFNPVIAPRPLAVGGMMKQKQSGGRDVAPIGAGLQVPRAKPVGLHRRGCYQAQAALEYVIALTGVVVLAYMSVNIWFWLNRTIAERQGAFNASRLAAGQVRTAGRPVGYQRPPISLLGTVNDPSTYFDPGDPGSLPPPSQAPCDDALLLIRKMRKLQQETLFIGLKLNVIALRAGYVGGVQQCLGNRIANWDCGDEDEDECDYANAQLDILRALMEDVLSPMQTQYRDRLAELSVEVQSVSDQFNQICQGGPGPSPYVMSPLVGGPPLEAPCPDAQANYDAANALYDQAVVLFDQMIAALDAGDDNTAQNLSVQIQSLLFDPVSATDYDPLDPLGLPPSGSPPIAALGLFQAGAAMCDPNDRSNGGGCYVP